LKAPKIGVPFRLYNASEDKVIRDVLTQETGGKELAVTYLRQILVDAETRYTFVEKLYLCFFMHAPNLNVIYCILLALFLVKPM
jgi:hypothetical protein